MSSQAALLWPRRLRTSPCRSQRQSAPNYVLLMLLWACRPSTLGANHCDQTDGEEETVLLTQQYSEAGSCNSDVCNLKLTFLMADDDALSSLSSDIGFSDGSDLKLRYRLTLEVVGDLHDWYLGSKIYVNGIEVSYSCIACGDAGEACTPFYYCAKNVDITQYVVANTSDTGGTTLIEVGVGGSNLSQDACVDSPLDTSFQGQPYSLSAKADIARDWIQTDTGGPLSPLAAAILWCTMVALACIVIIISCLCCCRRLPRPRQLQRDSPGDVAVVNSTGSEDTVDTTSSDDTHTLQSRQVTVSWFTSQRGCCPICLEEPQVGDQWIAASCTHAMHLHCFRTLRRTQSNGGRLRCPECRALTAAEWKLEVVADATEIVAKV
mmetsp:Transcript_10524/g.38727  ORF Transcript_10524/g.38727 Transcript_10524/m.38727 type:complete len:379 (-) Transcript_10524:300-1436(-)